MITQTPPTATHVISVRLSSIATDLWQQEVDTEGSVLVVQILLELLDVLPEHLGRVSDTTNDAQTTCIGDCCCESWAGSNVHAGQDNWVLDAKELRKWSLDPLRRSTAALHFSVVEWLRHGVYMFLRGCVVW